MRNWHVEYPNIEQKNRHPEKKINSHICNHTINQNPEKINRSNDRNQKVKLSWVRTMCSMVLVSYRKWIKRKAVKRQQYQYQPWPWGSGRTHPPRLGAPSLAGNLLDLPKGRWADYIDGVITPLHHNKPEKWIVVNPKSAPFFGFDFDWEDIDCTILHPIWWLGAVGVRWERRSLRKSNTSEIEMGQVRIIWLYVWTRKCKETQNRNFLGEKNNPLN